MPESIETRASIQARRPRPLRLLLVEDNDDHALLLGSIARRSLEIQPKVERVGSLREARDLLESEMPDLVLLDLGLPESKGLETLDWLFDLFEALPVVVLTARSELEIGEAAVRKGALDFLSKDEVNERSLCRTIRYSLERYRQRCEVAQTLSGLEAFAHVAAHDLKSPLYTIQSVCEILASKAARGGLGERDLELIDVLKTSAAKSTRLVDGLLRFCKLGMAAVDLRPTPLDSLVDETLEALDEPVRESGGAIRREDLPVANCDRSLMAHVFQNLLLNALKFSGGRRPEVRVLGRVVGGEVEVAVEDNGVGIDPADRERVFEPFLRLRGEGDGSGLGLSICKRIVCAHGGRIWIEGRGEEPGARFVFRLPA